MNQFKKISLALLFLFLFINNGCKEEKCGCEGEVLFNLNSEEGYITYNKDSKFSSFTPKNVYGTFFTICDPVEAWDMISKFEDGADVIVWGRASDDCLKKMNAMYRNSYTLHLDSIIVDEFIK